MKFSKQKSITVLSLLTLLVTGCGSTSEKDSVASGVTSIKFLIDGDSVSSPALREMVEAYNNGQGVTDKVKVIIDKITNNSGENCKNQFLKSANYADNVVCVAEKKFHEYAVSYDRSKCPEGYFLDLSEYAKNDADYQANDIAQSAKDWMKMTFSTDTTSKKHVVGPEEKTIGIPYALNPQMNFYNKDAFAKEGINIISVSEEELSAYNTANSATFKPHGYAEYKTAPMAGLTASENLNGETVYKVFNNLIPMNWEEQRYLFKVFTQSYNPSSLTKFGYISEYWFNYGWSVGGDCMGYNGTDYDFTLLDKSQNYLVIKDGVNINGNVYNKGDIVRYEDRVNQNSIATMDGLYAIASEYDAVKEYVSLQVGTGTEVDDGMKGYGIADPDVGSANNSIKHDGVAFIRANYKNMSDLFSGTNGAKLDTCVPEQYREYVGGSTYQKDGNTGFANERLKVIGETYDGEEYTGDLKVVNGTEIVGKKTTVGGLYSLVVPACSEPEKYQASWDFISWVATEGQSYIAKTTTFCPVSAKALNSEEFLNLTFNGNKVNMASYREVAKDVSVGDWGYFESGQWVTNWANNFNNNVRYGLKTLSQFESESGATAKKDLNSMKIIIKGIR